MTDADLASSESFTDDRLLGGRVALRQPATGYRVAIDPVLLAAAVHAAPGMRVLDAGCGTGAAMFCLAVRCPDVTVIGLERSNASAALCQAGIGLNALAGRAALFAGDLARPPDMGAAFDIVMTNPPFGVDGTPPPDPGRAAAHQEDDLDLAAWVRACLKCLKPKGRLVMIHRADRLSEVLSALRERDAGDIRILPIFPKTGEPARRVIVDAGKARRSPDTLLAGLVLHEADGRYTPVAEAILRDGAALIG